jgi:hypothetical protein
MRSGAGLISAMMALLVPAIAISRTAPPPPVEPVRVAPFPCLPGGTPKDAQIIALGAYEGGGPSPVAVAGDGHETRSIAVSGDRRGKPVILVLSAYDPVLWDLKSFPAARLKAVLFFGYHGQAVVGVRKSVIVRFSTVRGGDGACGAYNYAYVGGPRLEKLDAAIRKSVGRGIDRFQGSYQATGYNIDHDTLPVPDVDQVTMADLRTSEPFEGGQLAGASGLAKLIAIGAIRRATASDLEAVNAALTRASPTGRLAPVRATPRVDSIYVVLQALTVPRGMYGAHSATFVIPQGVPDPVDHGSHNSYIRLADGSMTGVAIPLD